MQRKSDGFSAVEVILLLLVVILIAVIGWLVYKNHQKLKPATKNDTSVQSSINSQNKTSATNESGLADTNGWATYTSHLGGISFKYPKTGWTFDGYQRYRPVTAPEMNGMETQLRLIEKPSAIAKPATINNNIFSIVINLSNAPNQVASESSNVFSRGSVSGLSNGLQIWQPNETDVTSTKCFESADGAPIDLDLVQNGYFYYYLKNGEYMSYLGTFCYGQKNTTNLSFQKQVNSNEWITAKMVLESLTQT